MYAAKGIHSEDTLAEFSELARQLDTQFSPRDRTVFTRFGPAQPVGFTVNGFLLRVQARLRSVFIANAQSNDCDCSTQADCGAGYQCITAEWCTPVVNCGDGRKEKCTKVCWAPGEY
jgi:hypothetical protein